MNPILFAKKEILTNTDFNTLSAIIDISEAGLLLVDKNGNIQLWNQWLVKHTGFSQEAVLGKAITYIFPEIKGKRILRCIDDTIIHGQSCLLSSVLNPSPFPIKEINTDNDCDKLMKQSVISRPIKDSNNEKSCFLQIFDVTQSFAREQLLKDQSRKANIARDEAQRLSKTKSEFISTVSHELRTPLTSILGALKLVLHSHQDIFPSPAKHLMDIALRNTNRLLTLINDLLDVQKITSGNMEFHFEKHNLLDILKQAIEMDKPYAEQYQVTFELNASSEDAKVLLDENRILQVIDNLLSNAAKFSPVNSKISIFCLLTSNDTVRLEVHDQGCGIPEEYHSSIFQPFTQADSSDTRSIGGTGLGLNIARSIITSHKGSIGFNSKQGEGTCFYFELPTTSD